MVDAIAESKTPTRPLDEPPGKRVPEQLKRGFGTQQFALSVINPKSGATTDQPAEVSSKFAEKVVEVRRNNREAGVREPSVLMPAALLDDLSAEDQEEFYSFFGHRVHKDQLGSTLLGRGSFQTFSMSRPYQDTQFEIMVHYIPVYTEATRNIMLLQVTPETYNKWQSYFETEREDPLERIDVPRGFKGRVVPQKITYIGKGKKSGITETANIGTQSGEVNSRNREGTRSRYFVNAATSRGEREVNQDKITVLERELPDNTKLIYAGVKDGLGGYIAGDEASDIAGEAASDFFQRLSNNDLRIIKEDARKLGVHYGSVLMERLLQWQNRKVCGRNERMGYQSGTTVTSVIILGDYSFVGSVGDSRTSLHISDGSLSKTTRDHSFPERLFAAGLIDEQEIVNHPQSNVITQSIQDEPNMRFFREGQKNPEDITAAPNIYAWSIPKNGKLALVCDGINGGLARKGMSVEDVMKRKEANPANVLVSEAIPASGDNDTAIVIQRIA
jgi:protein phosphatase